jgi:hypothetical protein
MKDDLRDDIRADLEFNGEPPFLPELSALDEAMAECGITPDSLDLDAVNESLRDFLDRKCRTTLESEEECSNGSCSFSTRR